MKVYSLTMKDDVVFRFTISNKRLAPPGSKTLIEKLLKIELTEYFDKKYFIVLICRENKLVIFECLESKDQNNGKKKILIVGSADTLLGVPIAEINTRGLSQKGIGKIKEIILNQIDYSMK